MWVKGASPVKTHLEMISMANSKAGVCQPKWISQLDFQFEWWGNFYAALLGQRPIGKLPKVCAEVTDLAHRNYLNFSSTNSVTSTNLITRSSLTGDSLIHMHHYSAHGMNSISLGLFLGIREKLKSNVSTSNIA